MKNIRELLIINGLLCSSFLYGISDNSQFESARSISLSHATVATYGLLNPASAILFENSFLSATYENKYITKELSTTTFASLYKSKFADFSFCANYFGYEFFNETSLSLSTSKELFDWLALGVRFNYSSFDFYSEDGRSNQLSAGLGFLFFQHRNLNLGLNLGNILRVRTDRNYDSLPLSLPFHYELGLAYHVLPELTFLFQLSQWESESVKLSAAAEYKGFPSFPLRIGLSGMPFSPSFGTGYICDSFQIDVAASYHLYLGFSPSVTLTYRF
ncbi:MAG: hypothetical protein ACRC9Q_07700 [Bacteroidales bacterium]